MFTKEVFNITLADEVADRLFDNITASNYGADRTFTATLRVMLHGRLPGHESLHLALIPLGESFLTADMITERIRQNGRDHNYTIYIVYPQDRQFGDQMLGHIRSHVEKAKNILVHMRFRKICEFSISKC